MSMTEFEKELEHLINKHCLENDSNTPDFILAKAVRGFIETFSTAVMEREKWYGRAAEPGSFYQDLQPDSEMCKDQPRCIEGDPKGFGWVIPKGFGWVIPKGSKP